MLRPKKTIPRLAVATLALTGCDGSDGNIEGSLEAYCMKVAECYTDESAVEVCVDYYNVFIAEYGTMPGCEGALIEFFDCVSAAACEDLMIGDLTCYDEGNAVNAACDADQG